MSDLHAYQVGRPYHPGRRSWPEQAQYNYRAGGHELVLFLTRPSSREVRAVTRVSAEFALHVASDGDPIVLLYRFSNQDSSGLPWSDAPYSWHLVPQEERTLATAWAFGQPSSANPAHVLQT